VNSASRVRGLRPLLRSSREYEQDSLPRIKKLAPQALAPLGERVASPFALPLRTALSAAKGLRVNSASRVRGFSRLFSKEE
jgi:hypothetical protein